jgi:hypothetical protein
MATESIDADLAAAAIGGGDPIFPEQALSCSYIKDEWTTNEFFLWKCRFYPPI